jgi:hypothetical protein
MTGVPGKQGPCDHHRAALVQRLRAQAAVIRKEPDSVGEALAPFFL